MSQTRPAATLLVLGGTAEGRAAAALAAQHPHLHVVTSLAGRVREPAPVVGEVREGGFGGVAGLTAWLQRYTCAAIIDATHPFAAVMSQHAAEAARAVGVPIVRYTRPPWEPHPMDRWIGAASVIEAASLVDQLGSRALITTGRQTAAAYRDVQTWCLLRSIDHPVEPLPQHHEILLDRGPFTVAGELGLLREQCIDVVVTKNSGGDATVAKLHAARELRLPVVMVTRPAEEPGVPVVHHADAALAWVRAQV